MLNGLIRCVRHADVADDFLVTAWLDKDVAIFRVPNSALAFETYRLMDGACAADLLLREIAVDSKSRLSFATPAMTVLGDALERGLLGLAAEVLGIVSAANYTTFRYLGERKQFGVPLATFQALQHRVADMAIAEQELRALLELSIESFAQPRGAHRTALLAALKCVADSTGRRIGNESIQLHGGMGVSDELNISHFARRLATIRAELGSADVHRQRFSADIDLDKILGLQDSATALEWRESVRRFTQQHLPERIAMKGKHSFKIEKADYVEWQQTLHQHQLFGGQWPSTYGGQGWNLVKQLIFTQQTAVGNAPMLSPYGLKMVGPVLYTFGNDTQKQRHLPGILASTVWWCQGYSEPGAGSDLASLKTAAVRDGDIYVVNGAKLWTTEAHWADWMHCLVRTDISGKAQTGITFLLIDMKTPGITIKPIITIDGIHHTNAVFFDNVRVPISNRVGEEGKGWQIAKFLLSNERVSIADTGPKLRLLTHVRELFRAAERNTDLSDRVLALHANEFADLSIQLLTLCAMERQFVEAWDAGKPFGSEASMLKIRGTEILQSICELALKLEGPYAAAHDPLDSDRSPDAPLSAAQSASLLAYEYLYSRCWSIFGGTNEVQRNIIAKDLLRA